MEKYSYQHIFANPLLQIRMLLDEQQCKFTTYTKKYIVTDQINR